MRRVLVAFILGLSIFSFPFLHEVKAVGAADEYHVNIFCGQPASTCTTSLNVSNQNDIVLVAVYGDTTGNGVKGITDTAGLVYLPRAGPLQQASIWVIEEWYAKSVNPLLSDTITVTMNGSINTQWGVEVIAFSGINFQSPFDPHAPKTASGTTCSGWPTTNIPNGEVVVAFAGTNGQTAITGDTGFTIFASGVAPTGQTLNGEYEIFTSSQSLIQTSFSQTPCAASATWGIIIDTLCPGSTCSGGGAPSPNPTGFSSVSGLGGYPVPPQLADQNVLSLMMILTGIILLSAIPDIERKKKRKDSFA